MGKLNTAAARRASIRSAVTTIDKREATGEGALGYVRDAKSELVMLAITNMVGENAFYETAGKRDDRYEQLVRQVAIEAPGFILDFLTWLRTGARMRTAAIVGAIEVAAARRAHGKELPNAPTVRQVVNAVCQRADEPAELLAGWLARYGKPIPIAVKRGLADAMERLYHERNLLKYDGVDKALRMGDAINLVCPRYHKPAIRGTWRDALFGHAIDRRHNRPGETPQQLSVLRNNAQLRAVAGENPQALLSTHNLRGAGMTWEDALSLVGSRVDKKQLWEALIPVMHVDALVKNLRNFDVAGVSDEVAEQVIAKITDPAEVAASRIMPLRLLAAYRNAPSLRWSHPLEKALQATLANVPRLAGRTLLLLDVSGSMADRVSGRSQLNRADTAGIFAAAVALRCEAPTLVWFNTLTGRINVQPGESLLRLIERIPHPGGGTLTAAAAQRWYAGHDQVLCFTDEQAGGARGGGYWGNSYGNISDYVPKDIPLITCNVAGYRTAQHESGTGKRYAIGGLSDTMFQLIPTMLSGLSTGWPWEIAAAR